MESDKNLVIGIDASTTACKAVIWNLHGQQISIGRCEIPLSSLKPTWHEQSAPDWWDALCKAISSATEDIDLNHLAGVCICPQRETFVPVDRDGHPLRHAILWMDNRAQAYLPEIEKALPEFHTITGKPLTGNLTVPKILWLRENEPDIFTQTDKFLDVAAYLNFYLTGIFGTGWSIAGPTGLFDMRVGRWSEDVLQLLDIQTNQLPTAFQTGSIIGHITEVAAQECNLPVGLAVIAGVGDGQSGGLGVKITSPGECYVSLGTSVVSGTFSESYVTDIAYRTMYAGIPDACSLETVILGGTYTIDWFMDNFSGGYPISHFEQEITELPPGADGLVLVPYWNGVLTPFRDPAASGIVVGWQGHHRAAHLYRAILEGIAYELRLHFEGVEASLKQAIDRVILIGGGSKSDVWCQIISDVTGKEMHRADVSEATSLGAGILAAYGVGIFDSIQDAANIMGAETETMFLPDPQQYKTYSRLYEDVYRHLFVNLQPLIRQLSWKPDRE